MGETTEWIPENFSLNARAIMRMFYAVRDLQKDISADEFSIFVRSFEKEIRDAIDSEPAQISMNDFQMLLESEKRG